MANAKILEQKSLVVDEIKGKFENAKSVVVFDYRGLSVAEVTELRKKLKETDSDYKVYKNTLTKRALDSLELSLDDCVVGPSAMVYSLDAVAPIKVVTNFAKDHEALSVKGGIIDGKISSLEELAAIATIPSRDGLLTMLAGGMIAIAKDLSIALNLYAEQKEN